MGENFKSGELLFREELFRGNWLEGKSLGEGGGGRNCHRANFIVGKCPRVNYLRVIIWGLIDLGEISWEALIRGAVFWWGGGGRELVRGNCPGSESPRVIVLGDFMGDNCPGGSRPWGNILIPLKHKK